MSIALASALVLIGYGTMVLLAPTLPEATAGPSLISAALMGAGSAGFYVLWEHVLSGFGDDDIARIALLVTSIRLRDGTDGRLASNAALHPASLGRSVSAPGAGTLRAFRLLRVHSKQEMLDLIDRVKRDGRPSHVLTGSPERSSHRPTPDHPHRQPPPGPS